MATSVAANEVSSGPVALSANTEDQVNFAEDIDFVEVLVLSGTTVWFSVNKQTATVGGKHCYVATSSAPLVVPVPTSGVTQVRLIADATASVVVTKA